MATFPDITAPSYGLEEETYRPQIRTEFENGAVQSRPRFTGTKKRWPNLSWAVLEESEFQTLEAFFIANQGLTFTWTHPVTSAVYTCRFSKGHPEKLFRQQPARVSTG